MWVDETGTNRRDNNYSQVWVLSPRDDTCFSAMSLAEGIISTEITNTTVSGDSFYDFVRDFPIPNMLPYDGVNETSVVVMDNSSIHHIEPVTSMLNEAGVDTLFFPPYSSDRNPIEKVFSNVKYYLGNHDSILQHIPDPVI